MCMMQLLVFKNKFAYVKFILWREIDWLVDNYFVLVITNFSDL